VPKAAEKILGLQSLAYMAQEDRYFDLPEEAAGFTAEV
jgi:hypothetical protein